MTQSNQNDYSTNPKTDIFTPPKTNNINKNMVKPEFLETKIYKTRTKQTRRIKEI